RRRMPLIAAGSLLFSVAWALFLFASETSSGWAAAPIFLGAIVIYGVGECLYTLVMVPVVTAIAPAALRARYLAVIGMSSQAAYLLAPAVGAQLISASVAALPVACAGVCVLAAVFALRIETAIPLADQRTPIRPKEVSRMRWV